MLLTFLRVMTQKTKWGKDYVTFFLQMGIFSIAAPFAMMIYYKDSLETPLRGVLSGIFLGIIFLIVWIAQVFRKPPTQ